MCNALGFHKSLSAAAVTLVVDTVLLMIMLIGLLRTAHRSLTGLWYLLYQQVMPYLLLPPVADILQVHHLDSLGGYGGGASCSECGNIP